MDIIATLKNIEVLKSTAINIVVNSKDALRIAKHPNMTKQGCNTLLQNQHKIISSLTESIDLASTIIENLVSENNRLNHQLNTYNHAVDSQVSNN